MGLIQSKAKSGNIHCIAWGKVNCEPKHQVTAKGTHLTKFFLSYDANTSNGKRQYETIAVECWNKIAEYASLLEKLDDVLIVGTLNQDTYRNDGSYKLTADMIYPMTFSDDIEQSQDVSEYDSQESYIEEEPWC